MSWGVVYIIHDDPFVVDLQVCSTEHAESVVFSVAVSAQRQDKGVFGHQRNGGSWEPDVFTEDGGFDRLIMSHRYTQYMCYHKNVPHTCFRSFFWEVNVHHSVVI